MFCIVFYHFLPVHGWQKRQKGGWNRQFGEVKSLCNMIGVLLFLSAFNPFSTKPEVPSYLFFFEILTLACFPVPIFILSVVSSTFFERDIFIFVLKDRLFLKLCWECLCQVLIHYFVLIPETASGGWGKKAESSNPHAYLMRAAPHREEGRKQTKAMNSGRETNLSFDHHYSHPGTIAEKEIRFTLSILYEGRSIVPYRRFPVHISLLLLFPVREHTARSDQDTTAWGKTSPKTSPNIQNIPWAHP